MATEMTSYDIDTAHSEIGFTVRHMMFTKVRGQFRTWTADVDYNTADPTKSSVRVQIDMASIDTHDSPRDNYLRSADFFDAEKYPRMVFKSRRIERKGDGKYNVIGDLTIRDATHEVTLRVEQTGSGKDSRDHHRLGFSGRASISRSEWGLKWNQALEAGGVLVSDKVDIGIEVQLVDKK